MNDPVFVAAHERRIPLERFTAPRSDLGYEARQERLDAIPPAESTPSGGDSENKNSKEETTMIHRMWSSDHLVKALFDQNEVWIDAAATTHKIEEMKLDHVLNIVLMMERMAASDEFPFDAAALQSKALYETMYARLLKALTGLDVDEPEEVPVRPTMQWFEGEQRVRAFLETCVPSVGRPSRAVVIDYTTEDRTRGERKVAPLQVQLDSTARLAPFLVAKKADGSLRTYRLDRIHRARLA